MADPVRLRLSRAKGFQLRILSLFANGKEAVSVARPAKWGNPFRIGWIRATGSGLDYREEQIPDAETAVRFFREMIEESDRNYPSNAEIRAQLRGKNLACWCKPGEPCHADVLLDIANRPACEEVTP